MGELFVNPLLLGGLALASAPLIIHLLNMESKIKNLDEFGEQIYKELERFAAFNGRDRIAPGSASPPSLERLLRHHRWC